MTTDKRTYQERKEYYQKWKAQNLEKRREYLRQWYLNNKDKTKERNYRWRGKVRFNFQEFKSTLYCAHCGENEPECLDFHHLDPSQKDRSVSKGMSSWSYDRVMAEIQKCIVLCANCHRKEHKRLRINELFNKK